MMNVFLKPDLLTKYTLVDIGVPLIVGDIVLEIQKRELVTPEKYVGYTIEVSMDGQIPAGESTGVDVMGVLWDKVHDGKQQIAEYIDQNIEFGLSFMGEPGTNSFKYFAGSYLINDLPDQSNFEDFEVKELSAGKYIVCRIEAESFEQLVSEALYKATGYLHQVWLPKHEITIEPFEAEKYNTNYDDGYRMEILVKY